MSKNFKVITGGPVVPTGVNPKSFNSIKIQAGATYQFKNGNVAKMTAGKIRVRNEEEKSFTDDNSAYVSKNDIVEITGPVTAVNEDKNEFASARVFTSLSYKPSKPDQKPSKPDQKPSKTKK